jgi:hypothetical protein
LTANADVAFEALRDGDRVLDFGLLPSLRVTHVSTPDGKETAFIQESRRDDGSFYTVLPKATVKGQAYSLHIEYEGNRGAGRRRQREFLSGRAHQLVP